MFIANKLFILLYNQERTLNFNINTYEKGTLLSFK